ncbi:MAG: hypothetical protein JRJ29_07980 [Deltaproteobacteria bacterium]|nr:hypothetical protein [Deltaproteobacteria bacterium]
MYFRTKVGLLIIGIGLLLFMSACAQSRAKIRIEKGLTARDLASERDKFLIYYAGSPSRPIGILFDPKNDGVRLVGERWVKVEDERTLSLILEAIQDGTSLNKITARQGDQLFGYFSKTEYTRIVRPSVTSGYSVLARIVDENTVRVDLVRYQEQIPSNY